MKNIGMTAYYAFVVVFVFTSTIYLPLQRYESFSIEYANARLAELKAAKGTQYLDEKSEEVKKILDTSHDQGMNSRRFQASTDCFLAQQS